MLPQQPRPSSSALLPTDAAIDSTSSSSSVRPRNRRPVSTVGSSSTANPSSANSTATVRGASPLPAARVGAATSRNNSGTRAAAPSPRIRARDGPGAGIGAGSGAGAGAGAGSLSSGLSSLGSGLLQGSWSSSWASVQDFASSLLAGGEESDGRDRDTGPGKPGSRNLSRGKAKTPGGVYATRTATDAWGPAPPDSRPRIEDVATGSLAEREEALKAMKKASVLESHDGVNGGLDVTGKFKKRSSDENLRGSSQAEEVEEHLVYIHHVKPEDTYAGIVLKYKCREDAFRKANGLWSRDNIQIRKWLALPVDACEVKGRLCDPPTTSPSVDLLATTPEPKDAFGKDGHGILDDAFGHHSTTNGKSGDQTKPDDDERPWTHVRWVSIDAIPHPVEIARVSRKNLGYFPPRRKKSLLTASTFSTPRGSMDVPSITLSSEAAMDSPPSTSSPHHSFPNTRPQLLAAVQAGLSTPNSARSRVGSGGDEIKPAWMRRPGGVGSLGRHVRMPGPEKDYFNSWTRRHIPSLNIESLPSMSVMGSETARFGFGTPAEENPGIVESPFEEGRDTSSTSRQQSGTGLDKAAAAIETWLRGAFAKRPATPVLGPRRRAASTGLEEEGDLIELADTPSDEDRGYLSGEGPADFTESGLLSQSMMTYGSSSRSGRVGDGTIRGRASAGGAGKGKKVD